MGEESPDRNTNKPLSEDFLCYASNTTLHGINHVVAETSRIRRVLWLVSFLCLLGWFTSYFIERTLYLTSSPTTTRVTVQDQDRLQFPAVTICNYNLARKSVVESNPDYRSLGVLLANFTSQKPYRLSDVTSGAFDVNLTEFYVMAAPTFDETVISCSFSAFPCEQYFIAVTTRIGRCFTFNSHELIEQHGSLFNVSRTGIEYGLKMRINVNQDEYFAPFTLSAGIKVLVHHPNKFPPIQQHGFGVMPGTETMCSISEVHRSELAATRASGNTTCVDTTSKDFINPLRYYKYYSSYACKQECLTNIIIQNCSCVPYYLQGLSKRHCTVNETYTCVIDVEYAVFADLSFEKACGCKKPCDDIYYLYSLSAASFPSEYVSRQMMDEYDIGREFIRDNYLELRIYFEELSYERIEQIPSYTSSDFQGDVGGQLGLCLGASLLTLLEFIEYVYMAIKRIFQVKADHRVADSLDVSKEQNFNSSAQSKDFRFSHEKNMTQITHN